ncbi:MAG: c-type cytochrome, partial [Acidobacteriota bacterium]
MGTSKARAGAPLRWILVAGLAFGVAFAAQAQDTSNELGQQVYTKWCGHCHGDEGDGLGVAASRLKPKPRDFTSGKYKIRMTTTGNIPTDDDLVNAIRKGLYGTSMPAFPETFLSDAEVDAVVAYIKSFSDWFADPELQNPETITIPDPPPYDLEAAQTTGRQVYEETGCARCHGEKGRGDGPSAPTLVDDWGDHIKVADLSQPWTFRGGGSRRDIYRSMSTGFNGTPMPGFHNNLGATPEESQQRMWAIVDYMLSLSGGPREAEESPYANLLRSVPTEDEIDLEKGAELFANAPAATFPIFGQIVEPGRNFYPSVVSVTAQAIHNESEIAFRLTWNDMRAEAGGTNAPDLAVPTWDEHLAETGAGGDTGGDDEGGFWGDEVADDEGDIWGDDAVEDEPADDGDFWGDDAVKDDGADDFWGEEDTGGAGAAAGDTPDTEFSDAFALQFPLTKPEGVRQPYFLFGDVQNPVDLWFVDLAKPQTTQRYEGRGSSAITPAEGGDEVFTTAVYEEGQWSVIYKRKRKSGGLSFDEDQFVPLAFSVWDGFNRERGNRRGLSAWYQVYVEPLAKPSP